MTIQTMEAEVYYSPTKNRRYFSKKSAIYGEVRARIYKKYPREKPEYHEGMMICPGYDIAFDRPEFYQRAIRYLTYLLKINT
ncbi:hypothetical protein [Xenorhabdus stockiae]|uniref:hypothetical protein n=1 Tax=Xenorhabdus stockiae TaxID=351614 RepID=UPI00406281E4